MNTLDAMKMRKSSRSFQRKQITKEELNAVLAAGSIAPVSKGDYSTYKLVVIQNKEVLEEIKVSTAKALGDETINTLYDAPTLIVICAQVAEGPRTGVDYASTSCIAQNMLLAATDLHLANIYLWSFKSGVESNKELLEKLNLPDNYRINCAVALGYPTEEIVCEKELENTLETQFIL